MQGQSTTLSNPSLTLALNGSQIIWSKLPLTLGFVGRLFLNILNSKELEH